MILTKTRSVKDIKTQFSSNSSLYKNSNSRISFSSLLKDHQNDSKKICIQKSRQISKQNINPNRKMLFSETRNLDNRVNSPYCFKERSSLKNEQNSNKNNLFATLIRSKKQTSLLEPDNYENICKLSHQTTDSEYWSNPIHSHCRNNSKIQKRPTSKYLNIKQPMIKPKNKIRQKRNQQISYEYFFQHQDNEPKKYSMENEISFGQIQQVNTSKSSVNFDMCPYL